MLNYPFEPCTDQSSAAASLHVVLHEQVNDGTSIRMFGGFALLKVLIGPSHISCSTFFQFERIQDHPSCILSVMSKYIADRVLPTLLFLLSRIFWKMHCLLSALLSSCFHAKL